MITLLVSLLLSTAVHADALSDALDRAEADRVQAAKQYTQTVVINTTDAQDVATK